MGQDSQFYLRIASSEAGFNVLRRVTLFGMTCTFGLSRAKANTFSISKGWQFLEVGAPGLPRWQRTVDFYLGNGFSVIGPRLERNTGLLALA